MWLQEDESKEPFASKKDPAERQAFVKELHLLKTDIFMRMVESGMMPLRPGVKRLVGAAPWHAILQHGESMFTAPGSFILNKAARQILQERDGASATACLLLPVL